MSLLLLAACAPVEMSNTATPLPTRIVPTNTAMATITSTATATVTATATETVAPSPTATITRTPTATPPPVAYDHNPNALLIEADVTGGSPVRNPEIHVPLFRLYGDGFVVYAGEPVPTSARADATVKIGYLSSGEIQALYADLKSSGFFELDAFYQPTPRPNDAPTARLTVYLDRIKTVRVYAAGAEGTPPAFNDAFARVLKSLPTEARPFVPTSGFVQADDGGLYANRPAGLEVLTWPSDFDFHPRDVRLGKIVEGAVYDRLADLLAANYPNAIFRDLERIYRLRLFPNLPRAAHLTDRVANLVDAPREFEGRDFNLIGYFRGADLLGEVNQAPPVTRSDWVIADASGVIYVTGEMPPGLDLHDRADAWRVVRVYGVLQRNANKQPYLTATFAQNVSSFGAPMLYPASITSADDAIAKIKQMYSDLLHITQTPEGTIGASTNIFVQPTANGWNLIFWEGWGDCPSGCINNRYVYFTVTRAGSISRVGEYLRVYNSAMNVFEVTGQPRFGVPRAP